MGKEKSLSTPQKKDSNIQFDNNKLCKEKFTLTDIQSISKNNLPVYKLFKQKEYEALKEHFENMDVYFKGQTFYSHFEFKEYLIRHESINMRDLLELSQDDTKKTFDDVLNPLDTKNKVSIFRSNTLGIEYYSYKEKGKYNHKNLIQVIGELIGEKQQATIEKIAELFGIDIKQPKEITEIKDSATYMVNSLRSETLKEDMPNFYKIFGAYTLELSYLIEVISKQEHYFSIKENKYDIFSFLPIRGFILKYEKEYTGRHLSVTTMFRNISSAVLAGFLIKAKESDLPEPILSISKAPRKLNKYKNRTDVLRLPFYTPEKLNEIENKCKLMVENKFNRKNISKDMLVSSYSSDDVDKTFIQLKVNEKSLSDKSYKMIDKASKIISKQITKKGYITEINLIEMLLKNNRRTSKDLNQKEIISILGKVSSAICTENNFETCRLNKKLRLELNISEKDIPSNKQPKIYKAK